MKEIELKARVADVCTVEKLIGTFATFERSVVRDDTYYVNSSLKGHKIRFRLETCGKNKSWLVTYKKKENTQDSEMEAEEIMDSEKNNTMDSESENTELEE